MKHPKLFRALTVISYLLPAVTAIVLLIYFFVPHVFFIYQGEVHETISLFRLISNAWKQCRSNLDQSSISPELRSFSHLISAAVVIGWVGLILHMIVSILTAITSLCAFSHAPTEKASNVAKRVLHLICPNRLLLLICNLLPLLPTLFPYILEHEYQSRLLMNMKLHSMGPSAFWVMLTLVLLCEVGLLALIPAEKTLHMNMFQLYKKK